MEFGRAGRLGQAPAGELLQALQPIAHGLSETSPVASLTTRIASASQALTCL